MTVDEKSEAASTAIEATSDQEPINSPEYGSSPTIADFHRLLNYRRRVANCPNPTAITRATASRVTSRAARTSPSHGVMS